MPLEIIWKRMIGGLMTTIHEGNHRFDLRSFMVKHQYKVMLVSLVVGLMWVGICRLLAASWFLSRLSLLFALISFVPAGLVILVHGRALGPYPFMWWDRSDDVLTTRRSRKVEKAEIILMAGLWTIIFGVVVFIIFVAVR
jgi:hypothetical protein